MTTLPNAQLRVPDADGSVAASVGTVADLALGVASSFAVAQADINRGLKWVLGSREYPVYFQVGQPAELAANTGRFLYALPYQKIVYRAILGEKVKASVTTAGDNTDPSVVIPAPNAQLALPAAAGSREIDYVGALQTLTLGTNGTVVVSQTDVNRGMQWNLSAGAYGVFFQVGTPAQLTANLGSFFYALPNTKLVFPALLGQAVKASFTTAGDNTQPPVVSTTGALLVINNLSDLNNAATARGNLGVSATGADATYAARASNLSDLASATSARTNLGLGTAQAVAFAALTLGASILAGATFHIAPGVTPTTLTDGDIWTTTAGVFARISGATVGPFGSGSGAGALLAANNLSDVASAATSATNLGLGTTSRVTFGALALGASVIGGATFNVPQGAAPTSPVNGDIWTTSAGLFVRINGATVGPLASGAGAGGLTAANNLSDVASVTTSATNLGLGAASNVTHLTLSLAGSTSGTAKLQANAVAGAGVLTLPTGTDTIAAIAATQTLTNKTLTSPAISGPTLSGTVTAPDGGTWTTAGISTSQNIGTTAAFVGALLVGGGLVSSTLTLESTAVAGTSDSIIFKTGSQVTAMTINTNQSVAIAKLLQLAASATGGATLNLPQGAAPTSPTNGDIWTTSAGVFARIAGATVGPFGAGGGGGSGAVAQVNKTTGPLTSFNTVAMWGSGCTFTPTKSGNVLVVFTSNVAATATGANTVAMQIAFGTGTAPSTGGAAAGTTAGNQSKTTTASTSLFTMPCNAVITGLSVGTTYWIDAQVVDTASGIVSYQFTNASVSVVEI